MVSVSSVAAWNDGKRHIYMNVEVGYSGKYFSVSKTLQSVTFQLTPACNRPSSMRVQTDGRSVRVWELYVVVPV